jgi:predicted  nucleic acid-binding Zn-ribbon protein
MSRALNSARQRRAGVETPVAPQISSSQTGPSQSGLTLPQVISLVDTRLIRLEQFMKESQENNNTYKPVVEFRDSESNVVSAESDPNQLTDLNEILEEYNNRFVLLAEEMAALKDTIMKLQTYTMDVNKMLLEERVNVLSDLGADNSTFTMNGRSEDIEENISIEEVVS